jgi:hypothetical protein
LQLEFYNLVSLKRIKKNVHLSFIAPGFQAIGTESEDKASYASVVKSTSGPSSSEETSPAELNLTCRGKRQFCDITLESYFSGKNICES